MRNSSVVKLPQLNAYALYEDSVYIIKGVSRATNRVKLRNVTTNEISHVELATFKYSYERVYRVQEVASWINRSAQAIKLYEKAGYVNKPRCVEQSKHMTRFYRKEDVLDLYECVRFIHQGRPRKDGEVTNNTMPDYYTFLQLTKDKFKW